MERGDFLQLDRNALNKLLLLSDRQLEAVVLKLATEYGLDLSEFHVTPGNIKSLREALRTATDEDLTRLGEQLSDGGLKP
jgi:hypothetical protein